MRRIAFLVTLGILACAGVALAAANGFYSGTTGQGRSFSVTVTGGKVTRVHYLAAFTCSGSSRPYPAKTTVSGRLAIRNQKFSVKLKVAPKDYLTISGTFSGNKVKGSFSETYQIHTPAVTCKTGKVKYSAKL